MGLSKNLLGIKRGFSKAYKYFLNIRKNKSTSLNLKKSSKTHQSSLTLKGGSTSHLGLLPSGEKRKPLLLVALNHFILWLANHQRSTPAAELQFFCAGMNPLSLKDLLRASAPSGRAGFVSFWAFSPYLSHMRKFCILLVFFYFSTTSKSSLWTPRMATA